MPPIAPLEVAEKARIAHRVLRLKESGIITDQHLKQVAQLAVPGHLALKKAREEANGEPFDQGIGGTSSPAHALAPTALTVVHILDPEMEGPTDGEGFIEQLYGMSHEDIYKVWHECVMANLEATVPDDQMKVLRESWAADEKAYEKRQAKMVESGEWISHPVYGHNHAPSLANGLYDIGRQGFLDATIDWDTAVIKCDLSDSADYAVNLATHQFFSSVAAAHTNALGSVAQSPAFANKTTTAGVADADDITFTAVTGDVSEALVIYQASAVGGGADVAVGAQRLIAYIDTATGLPVTPNGGNITVTWDSASNRIFKL